VEECGRGDVLAGASGPTEPSTRPAVDQVMTGCGKLSCSYSVSRAVLPLITSVTQPLASPVHCSN
jgi:hypothetical protein